MAALQWDEQSKKTYQLGIHKVVLFVADSTSESGYATGVAWNGVSAVNESPSGAETTDIYANDAKYGSFRSAEQYGGTIEAYTSPEEFDACDGSAEIAPGVVVHQQNRKAFGLAFMNTIGNDTAGMDYAEVLHLVYNATASPSETNHETVNDSPDVSPLSWEFDTTPVNVPGYKPSSHFEFRSDRMNTTDWQNLLDKVHGTTSTESTLPTPAEIISMFGTTYTYTALTTEPTDWDSAYYSKYYTKYGTTYSLIPRQDSAPEFVSGQYYKRDAT